MDEDSAVNNPSDKDNNNDRVDEVNGEDFDDGCDNSISKETQFFLE